MRRLSLQSPFQANSPVSAGRRWMGLWVVAAAANMQACSAAEDSPKAMVEPSMPAPEATQQQREPSAISSEPADVVDEVPGESCALPPARIWKLTAAQYAALVESALGVEGVDRAALQETVALEGRFFDNEAAHLELSVPHTEALDRVASHAATQAVASPEALHPCLAAGLTDEHCTRQALTEVASRLYRRPASPEELKHVFTLFDQEAAAGAEHALAMALRVLLLDPNTLFRTELGEPAEPTENGRVRLTAYETASALAFSLSDAPPDAELLAAAAVGRLETPEQRAEQARRLLAKASSAAGLSGFFEQLFFNDQAHRQPKDAQLFPRWSAQVGSDMEQATRRFVEAVLWQEDARFATLLTADFSLLNARLLEFFDSSSRAAESGFQRHVLDGPRAGILTQPSFLTIHANRSHSDIIARGHFLRERLLCDELPPPPPNVAAVPPPPDELSTQRQRLEQHRSEPSCATCHALIDPLGHAFENFDAVGRYRQTENGIQLDTSGELTGTSRDGQFADAAELGQQLATHPDAESCFARHLYRYTQGLGGAELDSCAISRLNQQFEAAQGNLRELAVGMVADPSFVERSSMHTEMNEALP